MTNLRQPIGIRKLLLLATAPNAMSWPVVFTGTAISIVLHFSPSGNTVHGHIWVRVVMAVIGYLPSLAFVALVQRLVRAIKLENLKIGLILCSYLVGGAFRGVFFAYVFFSLGMSDSLNLPFRIFGSAVPFGFATAVATISVGALGESRERIKLFLVKRDELREALTELERTRETFQDRVSSEIEKRVESEINQLAGKPELGILLELKSLVGDFVRPLSHSLASAVPDWNPVRVLETKVGWRATLQKLKPELALRPVLLTTMSAATAAPAFITFFGWQRAIVMEAICITVIATLTTALKSILTRVPISLPLVARGLIATVSLLAVSMPAGLLADSYSKDPVNTHFVFDASITVVPTLGWILLIGGAANESSRELEQSLSETVANLRWLRARINLVNWFEHGELSRLLHGDVQSAIHFGILMFESDKSEPKEVIREMQDRIHRAFTKQRLPIDFVGQVEELADFWKDICAIKFKFNESLLERIKGDEVGKSALVDIISESCGNAIRHGKAKNVTVAIKAESESLLELQVTNDGDKPASRKKSGLGTSILNACTIDWSLTSGEKVLLRARLPIAQSLEG